MTSILPTKRYDRYTSEAPQSFGEADLDLGPPSTARHDDVLASAENALLLSYRPPAFSLAPHGKYAFSLAPTSLQPSVEPEAVSEAEPVSLSDSDVFVMPNIPLPPRTLQLTFPPTIPAPAVDDVEVVSSSDLATSGVAARSGATPTSGAVPSSATRPSAKFEIAPAASMPDSGSLSAIEVLSKPASSPRRPSVSLLAQVSAPTPSRTNHIAFGLVGVAMCALAGAFFVHRAAQSAHLEQKAHGIVAAVAVNAAPPSVDEPFGPPAPTVHVHAPAAAPSARHAAPAQPASAQPARSAETHAVPGAAPTDLDGMLAAANAVRARGDVRGARDRYVAIHKSSPRFLPAALGVADTTWDLGETDAARKVYAELATSYPQRLLPARVVERSGVGVVTDAPRN